MSIIRVTHGGTMTGGQRWSFGHTMSSNELSIPSADLIGYANGLQAALKTNLWTGSGVGKLAGANTTSVTYDRCTVYLKVAEGVPATQVAQSTGAAVAGVSNLASAPQVALVATLENGLSGRQNKGRMYLPATSGGLVAAGSFQMSSSDATAWATSVANYLAAARSLTVGSTGPHQPIVSSITAANPIIAASVDTVLDTQRRRRDKIIGSRGRTALPVG